MVDVWRELGKAVGRALKPLAEIGGAIWKSMGEAAADLAEGFAGTAEAVGEVVTPVITPALTGIMDQVTEDLSAASPPEEVQEAAQALAEALMQALEESIPDEHGSPPELATLLASVVGIVATNLGIIVGTSGVTMGLDLVHPVKELGFRAAGQVLLDNLQLPAIMGPALQAGTWSGVIVPLRMRMNQKFPYQVLPDTMLPYLRAKDVLTDEEYKESMSFYARDEVWSNHALANVWRYPSFSDLRTMIHRTDMTWDDAKTALEQSLIQADYVARYEELLPEFPGLGDLITMMVREVITKEKFIEMAGLMGLSTEWADAYYENHWILLPLGEVKKARHRGDILDGELLTYLKLHDYKTEPRPGIKTSDQDLAKELVWDLPGRIDSRWLFRWGEIDVGELRTLLEKNGLSPEWSERVAMATAKNQFLGEIGRQIANIKADYARGYSVEATLRNDLEALGQRAEIVEYHVLDALQDRRRSIRDDELRTLRAQYARGAMTLADVIAAVTLIIIDPVARTAWIEALPSAKQVLILEETFGTEINRLVANAKYDYVKGYVTKATMVARFTLLDLPDAVIEFHVMDADEDRARGHNDKQLAVIEEGYVDDLITWADVESMAKPILVDPDAYAIWLDGVWLNKHKAVRV